MAEMKSDVVGIVDVRFLNTDRRIKYVMAQSRLEVNLRRLLSQCENMAKEDPLKDWRLDKVRIICTPHTV
jgi:hypothetical protein